MLQARQYVEDKLRIRRFRFLALLLAFSVATICKADTHYVSKQGLHVWPYTNWQTAATFVNAAMLAAFDGDMVLVSNDLYALSEEIFVSKAVTLTSGSSAHSTVFHGQDRTRCIVIGSPGAVVSGFTFRNGISEKGGGVYMNGGMLTNCIVTANNATEGGGVYMNGGMLTNCIVTANNAIEVGGVYCRQNGVIVDCVISSNTARDDVGGVLIEYSGEMRDSVIFGNTCGDDAGGVQIDLDGVVVGCVVSNNVAGDRGGGVRLSHKGTCENSIITANQAHDGGGAYCTYARFPEDGPKVFRNCRIYDNHATGIGGGGLFYEMGTFVNCWVHDNTAGTYGGGIGEMYLDNALGTIENCTIWGNSAGAKGGGIGQGQFGTVGTEPRITVWNCIVLSNTASVAESNSSIPVNYSCTTPDVQGAGNITNSPEFVAGTRRNFRLKYGSPCIDAGTRLLSVTTDIDGNVRPLDGDGDGTNQHDIGACEYNPETADSNGDNVPDWWYLKYSIQPTDPGIAEADPDGDGLHTGHEYIADTDPTNRAYCLRIHGVGGRSSFVVEFVSSSNRVYWMERRSSLTQGNWDEVPSTRRFGIGNSDGFECGTSSSSEACFRIGVSLP